MDPFSDTMILTTLHWPDEIRSTNELDLPDEEPDFKPAELAMAKQLVSSMTGEFEPENYKDEYRDALMQVIEAKVEGHEAVAPEPAEEAGNLIDLMAALEASVKSAKAARSGEAPVSVSEAKKEREKRSADRDEEKKPAKAASRRKAAKDDEEEPAAASGGRSRRRKSA
jgi:DNA end-binding protein Ku